MFDCAQKPEWQRFERVGNAFNAQLACDAADALAEIVRDHDHGKASLVCFFYPSEVLGGKFGFPKAQQGIVQVDDQTANAQRRQFREGNVVQTRRKTVRSQHVRSRVRELLPTILGSFHNVPTRLTPIPPERRFLPTTIRSFGQLAHKDRTTISCMSHPTVVQFMGILSWSPRTIEQVFDSIFSK